MKRLVLNFLTLMIVVVSGVTFAQTAGFNSTFAVLSSNGGGNTYYDL
jgi:hypothetical protein